MYLPSPTAFPDDGIPSPAKFRGRRISSQRNIQASGISTQLNFGPSEPPGCCRQMRPPASFRRAEPIRRGEHGLLAEEPVDKHKHQPDPPLHGYYARRHSVCRRDVFPCQAPPPASAVVTVAGMDLTFPQRTNVHRCIKVHAYPSTCISYMRTLLLKPYALVSLGIPFLAVLPLNAFW